MDCTIINHNLQAIARRIPAQAGVPSMDVLYIRDEETRAEVAIIDIDEQLAMRLRRALDTLYPPRQAPLSCEAPLERESETTLA